MSATKTTIDKMTEINKVVHPADENLGTDERERFVPIFAKIEYKNGNLSISGVVGPKSNGDAAGSCGQIIMGFKEYDKRGYALLADLKPAPEWDQEMLRKFFDIWDRWHLNDMKASCEHQRALGWDPCKELTIYYFRLRRQVVDAIKNAKNRAEQAIKAEETFTPADFETTYLNLKSEITHHEPELPEGLAPYYEANGPQYMNDHFNKASDVKTAGWVNESEHPEGLLSKPCPECGYKYGTSWNREEVPQGVLDFLISLPDTDRQPAWV